MQSFVAARQYTFRILGRCGRELAANLAPVELPANEQNGQSKTAHRTDFTFLFFIPSSYRCFPNFGACFSNSSSAFSGDSYRVRAINSSSRLLGVGSYSNSPNRFRQLEPANSTHPLFQRYSIVIVWLRNEWPSTRKLIGVSVMQISFG